MTLSHSEGEEFAAPLGEVARRKLCRGERNKKRNILSPSHAIRMTAPSSEGALSMSPSLCHMLYDLYAMLMSPTRYAPHTMSYYYVVYIISKRCKEKRILRRYTPQNDTEILRFPKFCVLRDVL